MKNAIKAVLAIALFTVGMGSAYAIKQCTCEGKTTITRGDDGTVTIDCEGTMTCQL